MISKCYLLSLSKYTRRVGENRGSEGVWKMMGRVARGREGKGEGEEGKGGERSG